MPVVSSLPTLTVEIAYATGYNIFQAASTGGIWTDISQYVMDLRSTAGRQRMLDRVETSTCSFRLDNRTGYFSPLTNKARLPIRVQATWSGTTYNVFFGLTDSVTANAPDALSLEISIAASDYLRLMALRNTFNDTYYRNVVVGSGVTSWYRTGNVVSNRVLVDTLAGSIGNAEVNGTAALADGVLLYDNDQCLDLTNGTGIASAYVNWPTLGQVVTVPTSSQLVSSIDFWFYMPDGYNTTPLIPLCYFDGLFTVDASLYVSANGTLKSRLVSIYLPDVNLADGQWHHIGISRRGARTSNFAAYDLVLDGVVYSDFWSGSGVRVGDANYVVRMGCDLQFYLGIVPVYNSTTPVWNAYVDEVCLQTDTDWTASTATYIQARYKAGILFRQDQQPADRIDDILKLTGFLGLSYVNGDGNWSANSRKGTQWVAAEMDSLVNRSALDLVLACSDTEVGNFYQRPDGLFEFDGRDYYYNNTRTQNAQADLRDTQAGTSSYEAASLQLVNDDLDIWTRVVVNPVNGTPQTFDTGTDTLYGSSTMTRSSQPTSLADALSTAEYIGYLYKMPLRRVTNVELDSTTRNGLNMTDMLETRLFDRIHFQRTERTITTATDMIIERVAHDFVADPGLWRTTFILDPYPIRNTTQDSRPVLIVDDATYGQVDNNVVL